MNKNTSELADFIFHDFAHWASSNKLSKAASDALIKEHFTSEQRLAMLNEAYVRKIAEKYHLTEQDSRMLVQCIDKFSGTVNDTFDFIKWAKTNGLKKDAMDALKAEHYDTCQALSMLQEGELVTIVKKFNLSLGMKRRISNAVAKLKKTQLKENDSGEPANVSVDKHLDNHETMLPGNNDTNDLTRGPTVQVGQNKTLQVASVRSNESIHNKSKDQEEMGVNKEQNNSSNMHKNKVNTDECSHSHSPEFKSDLTVKSMESICDPTFKETQQRNSKYISETPANCDQPGNLYSTTKAHFRSKAAEAKCHTSNLEVNVNSIEHREAADGLPTSPPKNHYATLNGYCFYCEVYCKDNVWEHLTTEHKDEKLVKDALWYSSESTARKQKAMLLVKKGNFKHNCKVISSFHRLQFDCV